MSMSAVDEAGQHRPHQQQPRQGLGQEQEQGEQRFSERGRGGLSRASFVQAAAGSAAAVLALSLVSLHDPQ